MEYQNTSEQNYQRRAINKLQRDTYTIVTPEENIVNGLFLVTFPTLLGLLILTTHGYEPEDELIRTFYVNLLHTRKKYSELHMDLCWVLWNVMVIEGCTVPKQESTVNRERVMLQYLMWVHKTLAPNGAEQQHDSTLVPQSDSGSAAPLRCAARLRRPRRTAAVARAEL